MTGLLFSIMIHVAVAVAFLYMTYSDQAAGQDERIVPNASLEAIIEPLQVESQPEVEVDALEMASAESVEFDVESLLNTAPSMTNDSSDSIAVDSGDAGSGGFVVPDTGYVADFCGASQQANRVCFVVDCSGSMVIAFDYIKAQLIQSVSQLKPIQYFNVIFFAGGDPVVYQPGRLVRASAASRNDAVEFIRKMELTNVAGSTEAWQGVVNAMAAAFNSVAGSGTDREVELVYVLTDGEFDQNKVREHIRQLQSGRKAAAMISVIACGNRDNEPFLRKLATIYRGQYRFVSDEELASGVGY